MKNKLNIILFAAGVSIASTNAYGADFNHGCPSPANVANSQGNKGSYQFTSTEEYSKGDWTVNLYGKQKATELVSAAWVRMDGQVQLTCTYNDSIKLTSGVLGK
jgi:hypothetical protein